VRSLGGAGEVRAAETPHRPGATRDDDGEDSEAEEVIKELPRLSISRVASSSAGDVSAPLPQIHASTALRPVDI
jgi:hypothetical protein